MGAWRCNSGGDMCQKICFRGESEFKSGSTAKCVELKQNKKKKKRQTAQYSWVIKKEKLGNCAFCSGNPFDSYPIFGNGSWRCEHSTKGTKCTPKCQNGKKINSRVFCDRKKMSNGQIRTNPNKWARNRFIKKNYTLIGLLPLIRKLAI